MKDRLKTLVKAAVRTGEFTLASGKTSNFYFDGKQVTLDAEGALLTAQLMTDWLAQDKPDAVGGPTLGACPMVSAIGVLAHQRELPLKLFYVRSQAKDHGTGQQIEGPPLAKGTTAVLVEDTITTGGSLLKAIHASRDAGLVIDTVYCLLDREEGGVENLAKHGLTLKTVFKRSELV